MVQDSIAEQGRHSPWELFAHGVGVDQAAEETPCLNETITQKVACKVADLMSLERFAAFSELPDPAKRWLAAGLGREKLLLLGLLIVQSLNSHSFWKMQLSTHTFLEQSASKGLLDPMDKVLLPAMSPTACSNSLCKISLCMLHCTQLAGFHQM